MPKVVALIPARSGSKGVPNKNIRLLQAHPLLAYSIAAARKSNFIDAVYLSTDSAEYAAIGRSYGAEAPFLRPVELSADTSSDKEFVLHFLKWHYSAYQVYPDFIVHLRPTTPLRDPALIDKAIQLFENNVSATALRSVHEMSETAYKAFEMEANQLKTLFTGALDLDAANQARQSYPKTYQANGYVDILRVDFVLNSEGFHGDRVMAFITPTITEVDSIDDFNYLEYQIQNNPVYEQLFGKS